MSTNAQLPFDRLKTEFDALILRLRTEQLGRVLDNIPAYTDLRFDAHNGPSSPFKLHLGDYSNVEVFACFDGSAHGIVARALKYPERIGKRYVFPNTPEAFGQLPKCKLVAPFSWSIHLKKGIREQIDDVPLALVKYYLCMRAVEMGDERSLLMIPEHRHLVEALVSIQESEVYQAQVPAPPKGLVRIPKVRERNLVEAGLARTNGNDKDPKVRPKDSAANTLRNNFEIGETNKSQFGQMSHTLGMSIISFQVD